MRFLGSRWQRSAARLSHTARRRLRKSAKQRPETKRIAPEERRRRKLVRRSHFMTIVAAWVITVPAAALLSGGIFMLLSVFTS